MCSVFVRDRALYIFKKCPKTILLWYLHLPGADTVLLKKSPVMFGLIKTYLHVYSGILEVKHVEMEEKYLSPDSVAKGESATAERYWQLKPQWTTESWEEPWLISADSIQSPSTLPNSHFATTNGKGQGGNFAY